MRCNTQQIAKLLFGALVVANLCGCTQLIVNQRLQIYQSQLDPLVGKATKEQIVQQYGLPLRREQIGTLEIWQYHQTLGYRSTGSAYALSPGAAVSSGNSSEIYDDLTLTFSSTGVLQNWKALVSR